MRNLARNCATVFFKNLVGTEDTYDEYGNNVGSPAKVYGELKSCEMSISGNKGNAENQMFGIDLDYDRTLSTADMTCEIDEYSVLWLDGADTSGMHNYIVKKVAPTLNQIVYAVKRVDVSAN